MESRLVASLEADDKKQWSSDSDDSESDDEIPLKKTKITEKVELQQIDPLEESLEGLEKFNLENYDNEDGEEDDIAGGNDYYYIIPWLPWCCFVVLSLRELTGFNWSLWLIT